MFLILVALSFVVQSTPTTDIVDAIVARGCIANHSPPRDVVDQLLRIEVGAGVPNVARGILAAAACRESGFREHVGGDWYTLTGGKRCTRAQRDRGLCVAYSRGMMQLGRWAKRAMRRKWSSFTTLDPRMDWQRSAEFWIGHVVSQVARVRRECGYSDELDVWKASHATAVTKPKCARWRMGKNGKQRCAKYIPRCHRVGKHKSKHWAVRATWTVNAPRAVVADGD